MNPFETRKVHFKSGVLTLEGLLSGKPQTGGVGLVVCHPHPAYGGNMKNLVVAGLADAFAAKGMTALRFNFRGVGKSEGSHEDGHGEVGDVAAAIDYMTTELGLATIHLAGYSFGSSMMLKNAETDGRAASLIAVAPPVNFMEVSFGPKDGLTPKLIFSGGRDEYCTRESLMDWLAAVAEPKRVVLFDESDHFFAGREREIGEKASTFASEAKK